jgi:hypothetical protein
MLSREQLDRLPRYARDELTATYRHVEQLRLRLKELTGETITRVEIDPYAHTLKDHSRRFLYEHETVRYYVGRYNEGQIDVRLSEGCVEIMAHYNGRDNKDLVCTPRATNCLRLSFAHIEDRSANK